MVSIEAAEDLTSSRQEALNIHTGPLLVCDLLHVEGRSFLSLIAHHLVIDDVSWQIIITDFEALLATGKLAAAPTLSFQTWSQLSAEYANTIKKELSLDDYPPHWMITGALIASQIIGGTPWRRASVSRSTQLEAYSASRTMLSRHSQ